MAKAKSSPKPSEDISEILKVTQRDFECCIVGTSPLILNRMSEKAKHHLLMPPGRMTEFDKKTNMKHDPVAEYRASAYRLPDPQSPTYLAHLATAFKGAMRTAALDMPNASKSQIGRLAFVKGERVGIWGIPKMLMSVTRSADIKKTPDIRTRAILPEWACRLTVTFVEPLIKGQTVGNLLAAGGMTSGVGDWRTEKGSGNYGQFRLCSPEDPDFIRIIAAGGRKVQIAALETPVCYDDDTAEMFDWYTVEIGRRKAQGKTHKAKDEEAA